MLRCSMKGASRAKDDLDVPNKERARDYQAHVAHRGSGG